MKWRRLTLRVDAPDVEIASAFLTRVTGASVASDEPLDGGRTSVSAYVRASRGAVAAFDRALQRARRDGLLRSARKSSSVVAGEQWATSWKRYYEPSQLASRLWIVPSWRARSFRAPAGAATIVLDPGMAFGTGQHPTTKMAAALLLPLVRGGEPMVDVGCGSGILSIAAALRGAVVYASDVDPLAVAATRANLRSNRVRHATVVRASGVPSKFPRAPLLVANITADVLAPLARSFARTLTAGGHLVTSGVTTRGRVAVLDAFKASGLRLVEQRHRGEWLAFVHRKAAAG